MSTERKRHLDELRTRYRLKPDDIRLALQLGEDLEGEAAGMRPNKEFARPLLEEAARIYSGAARRARLRSWQAMFYSAAGRAYGQLGDGERQYQALAKAVERLPYAPRVWREYASACLRTGRARQNRLAVRKVREWTFPGLRAE